MRNLLIATTFIASLSVTSAQAPSPAPSTVPTPGNVREHPSATQAIPKRLLRPLAGATRFTEAQPQSRIEAHGFTAVSPAISPGERRKKHLAGLAAKDGQPIAVMLDFQGNVYS